jgi:hypothetical protein
MGRVKHSLQSRRDGAAALRGDGDDLLSTLACPFQAEKMEAEQLTDVTNVVGTPG